MPGGAPRLNSAFEFYLDVSIGSRYSYNSITGRDLTADAGGPSQPAAAMRPVNRWPISASHSHQSNLTGYLSGQSSDSVNTENRTQVFQGLLQNLQISTEQLYIVNNGTRY